MNLSVLEYVVENDHDNFLNAIDASHFNEDAARGVAAILLKNGGDLSVLKGRQVEVYEKCIKPIFQVKCEGLLGNDCIQFEFIDDESLYQSYLDDEFLCQLCRYDSGN